MNCIIMGCNRKVRCRRLCAKHYNGSRFIHICKARCKFCNKIIYISKWRKTHYDRNVFCNIAHQTSYFSRFIKKENRYNWIKSGRSKNGTEYWHIRDENGKWVREHRIIAEKIIGRKLKKREVVHHKNGIKADNSRRNLAILTRDRHPSDTYIKILQERIRQLENQLNRRI